MSLTLGEQCWQQPHEWLIEELPEGGLHRYPSLLEQYGVVAKIAHRGEGRIEGVCKVVNLQKVMDASDPRKRHRGPRVQPAERSDESLRVSSQRARVSVRSVCQRIGADRMLTFGTRAVISLSDLLVRYQRFVDAYEYSVKEKWLRVAVPELHKDGVHYHLHVAVAGWFRLSVALNIWHALCAYDFEEHPVNGSINVKTFTLRTAQDDIPSVIAAYIAKYVGKNLLLQFNKKNYWATRLPKEEIQRILLQAKTPELAIDEIGRRFGIDFASVILTHKGCFFVFPDDSGFWFRVTPTMHRTEIPF